MRTFNIIIFQNKYNPNKFICVKQYEQIKDRHIYFQQFIMKGVLAPFHISPAHNNYIKSGIKCLKVYLQDYKFYCHYEYFTERPKANIQDTLYVMSGKEYKYEERIKRN